MITPASAHPATLSVVGPTRGETSVKAPVATLRIADIGGELVGKRIQVRIEGSGPPEDLRISHPAQALVALRAIGRHTQKIAALSPQNIAPQLVHRRVGRLELDRKRRGGIEDDALDGVSRRRPRISGQFNIAESVESEVRLERFSSLPAQELSVGRLGRAQILGVEFAVWLEHFSKAQLDLGSRLACDVHPRPANHVLTKIEDVHAGLRIGDRLWLQCFVDPDGLKILRDDRRRRFGCRPPPLPTARRKMRAGPIPFCSNRAS